MDLMDFASDPTLEEEGAKIDIDDETTLIIARYGNIKFRKMRNRLIEPYQLKSGREGMSTDQADDVLNQCLAAHVLKGWKGLKIEGQEIEYSKDMALKLFRDPRFKSFKERVMGEANNLENYRLERLEDDLGNFVKSPSTGRGGKKSSKKRSSTKN